MLQTNSTVMCTQCLSHAGPAPAHGAHCSGSRLLRREPSEAGSRLHAPPRSKPLRLGAQVALRGTDSVGPAFCALPRYQVFGERSRWDLSPPPSLLLSFLGVQSTHVLRQILTVQNPKKS